MNTRIQIKIVELPLGKRPPCKRFVCWCVLPTRAKRRFPALIDTGSPFSIVPHRLWRNAVGMIEPLETPSDWKRIRGITGGGEPCEFGRIPVMLTDARASFSRWLRLPAQLAMNDKVPLALGVADFLDTYRVSLNENGSSYVVVPGI